MSAFASQHAADYALTADDLFAGAGGWDLGAAALGIHARGVEIMPEARATREAAGLTTIHDDVWTFFPDGKARGKIASPPCPTFSSAGTGSGRRALDSVLCAIDDGAYRDLDQLREYPVSDDDDRTRLVLTPLHFATQYDYEWLAWEQVPAVLPVWEACARVLRAQGWDVWTGKVHAEQFGVPQTRTRAVLIASRTRPVRAPKPTHSRYYSSDPTRADLGVLPWVSMAEGLGMNEAAVMISNYGTGGDPANRGRREGWQPAPTITSKIDRNRVIRTGQNSRIGQGQTKVYERAVELPSPTVTGQARSWRLTNRRDAPSWIAAHGERRNRTCDLPAPTITGEAHRWKWEQVVGDDEAVRLTVAAAGVLQSFSPDFPWQGGRVKQFLQAGNAVPCRMAMHVLAAATGLAIEELAA